MLQDDLTQKELLVGKEQFNMFIRYQYIQLIDRKWLDQLEFLDGLREAVYLRSYGSKNPLTEYKIDGFNAFDALLADIRSQVASRIFKVKIQIRPAEDMPLRRPVMQQMAARHDEAAPALAGRNAPTPGAGQQAAASAFNAREAQTMAQNSAMRGGRQGQSVTVVRTMPKVGRNDPCPCGSGKKYKNCHGRNA